MAKTSAVIERLKGQGIPYISVLTDPIYGGVSASLALLGDINIAEPDARAGFAGPNIIEQTIRQKLPKGFQRSEFLLEHGAIDMIVHRNEMRETLARVLAKLTAMPPPGQPPRRWRVRSSRQAERTSNSSMTDSTLSDWLERLQSQHPVEIDLGLERVSAVARALHLVPASMPTLTVAGTNGKGSVVAVLSSVCWQAVFALDPTPPHISSASMSGYA